MSYVTSAGRAAHSLASARVDKIDYHKPDGYNWVRLAKLDWTDPLGRKRTWEMAERCHPKPDNEVDGVAIICLVHNGNEDEPPDIIFVSQYRPPVKAECVEVPAGLIDEGETAETAALRELEEETGFVVGPSSISYVSSPCPCDPGMTNADMRWVVVNVDGSDPRHRDPAARPDDGEFIRTHRVPLPRALEWLEEREGEGMVVDARLYGLMIGFCQQCDDSSEGRSAALSPRTKRTSALGGKDAARTVLALAVGAFAGSFVTRLLLARR